MFVAPDPGRMRLRNALRAVIGIGLAVASAELAGLSLTASITGGLAALLALFTVLDATVRAQRVTTALLPLAGFPVLALATTLHGITLARDAAFLVVVLAGVYARRWGPRGHALGVFAFMSFFTTQFLHAVPAQLPELFAAVGLALLSAGAVRFVLWPIERRTPPPPTPPGLPGTGFARTTTRQALQATAACAVALSVGQVLSEDRWYWAVGTVWWIFVNTASRGETLVRGFRRVLGTVIGIGVGLLVAIPLDGAPAPTAALVAVCVFGIFYTAPVSYSWMMFAVTVMAGLLYGLLGVLDPGLLVLRFQETAVGAVCAALAVILVLPVTTHATNDAWIQRALRCVRTCTAEAAARLAGSPVADPAPHAAELELLLGRVRLSLAPLVHPLSPYAARKARARHVLSLLDECAAEVRGLVTVAADPDAGHDARLAAACRRVETAVEALISPGTPAGADGRPAAGLIPEQRAGEHALAHLHGLERLLTQLDAPLRTPSRGPLVSA
ncbi:MULTISPECIES: FUSC family protein [unclassified Streptomyces]|uniref:FUSC family protein n=1 Tax=unclassified Streptomyces TaxID=2593676 RepID=UPI0022706FEC|nr:MULTISPECIES: FUSC family protein [unclassified Streptomyces]MCY0918663.1 FUSC family protein [Streptomyces sp. H27-G5]MCY0956583.1 FUSC family protein [Streptomyces sp. H27-H5]